VTAEVVVNDGLGVPGHRTVLQLCWDSGDPLAVGLRVVAEPAHPALPQGEWVVLRDFLRYGLSEPTGDGDVRIRPNADAIALELISGIRRCLLQVPMPPLSAFLDTTEKIVPAGEERSEAAIDALIDRLLSR
jgi:hypothetical protein